VALAAADACREVAGVEAVLKWPNDLLVAGRKLAGVLAEAEFTGRRLAAAVVGIGLNVGWPGPDDAQGTCLDHLPGVVEPVDRRWLLDRLLANLEPWRRSLDDPAGRRALADEVRARCVTIGQEVLVALASEELHGVATGIDDKGRLVVETSAGLRHVTTGDVVHLRPAPGAEPS
jgi:BirA family biotin operon repressor/biotin-[acetyl-CoA-carboxylase] ligase